MITLRSIGFAVALLFFVAGAACAGAAEVVRLDFSAPPLARFEKELEAIRQKNGLVRAKPAPGRMALTFERSAARPGERWLVGQVEFSGDVPRDAQVEVELYAIG